MQRLGLAPRQVKQLPECDGPSGPEVGRPSRHRVLDQDRDPHRVRSRPSTWTANASDAPAED